MSAKLPVGQPDADDVMSPDAVQTLIPLLNRAAQELHAIGDAPTLTSYDTSRGLGDFIAKAAAKLGRGNDTDAIELYFIFAPTCDWDDSGGSLELGNKVFAQLDLLYRERALAKSRPT